MEEMDSGKDAMKKNLLLIFAKNPELGKVKTRLAETMGEEAALAVYFRLLTYTHSITKNLPCTKQVWYTDFVDREDQWENHLYEKKLQKGDNLGQRMAHAFQEGFAAGYQRICIIGTDNFELTPDILKEAFQSLHAVSAVVGPAKDGGYYLLGLTRMLPALFENKPWSTDTVLSLTLDDLKGANTPFHLLPVLRDVDREEDLNF
jgi:uncharacterized protein